MEAVFKINNQQLPAKALVHFRKVMTQFNENNTGYKDGYPLFLGPNLGILDTVNVQYPRLEELYQEQVSQIWNEFEIDLTQDKMDMLTLDKGTVDLMVKNLMWQTVGDTIATRSILETFGKYVTNSELVSLMTAWSFFEVIHARTYSHIIKQTFTDPNGMLEELYSDAEVLSRSETITKAFSNLSNCSVGFVRHPLLMALVALLGLESIAFMASFAVTFAIVETGKFQGIGKLVQLICRDEVLHASMSFEVIKILKEDPTWASVFRVSRPDIRTLLNDILEREFISADYVFSEGREVIGCNPKLLKQYILFMARPIYELFDLVPLTAPKENPLPYMDKYVDPSKVQTANMELQNTSYLIGTIDDDTFDLDLEHL